MIGVLSLSLFFELISRFNRCRCGFVVYSNRCAMRHFFLDKKVTKKSSQQRGFFAAQAFALQNG